MKEQDSVAGGLPEKEGSLIEVEVVAAVPWRALGRALRSGPFLSATSPSACFWRVQAVHIDGYFEQQRWHESEVTCPDWIAQARDGAYADLA